MKRFLKDGYWIDLIIPFNPATGEVRININNQEVTTSDYDEALKVVKELFEKIKKMYKEALEEEFGGGKMSD